MLLLNIDTCSWNPSSCKTGAYPFNIVNTMAADDLATQVLDR